MPGGVTWLEPAWGASARVRALSTCRTGGVSEGSYASLNLGSHVGDLAAAVAENRRRLRLAAGLPAEPVWLRQVHGTAVADLDAPDVAPTGRDAVLTRLPGRVCAILTADCVPVLFAAEDASVVGAAHAGWRGLAAGVLAATVAALAVPPQRLLAWIGPCIGPAHYEVGPEVREALLRIDPGAGAAFQGNAAGRLMADLACLAERQLRRLSLTRIESARRCTFAESERYFSHRRDGQTGRQASLIWLE